MTTVVATGVFTILHPGHVLYLEEARKLGDKLIVIVARDSMVEKKKNQRFVSEKQRLAVVKALKTVDSAVLGDEEDIFKPIEEIKPDIIALGKDQDFDVEALEKGLRDRGLKAKIVRIEKYWDEGLHSSRHIIAKIKEQENASQG
ncbi:MAG: FAD synthase [Candidatus Altiarchaeota archaeon]|nr:FAD synthase [Candidatus Altiarchaeota archaeon]